MAYFTNATPGDRGINLKDGTTSWVAPGQTVKIDDKLISDAHEDLTVSDKAPKADPEPQPEPQPEAE